MGKTYEPPTLINADIVKEFYANAMPTCDKKDMEAQFSFTTMVRGIIIHFDQDTINTYLVSPLTLKPSEDPTQPNLCGYGQKEEDKDWNHAEIVRDILLSGKRYNKGRSDDSTTTNFGDMTLKAAIIFKFLVHNVWPKNHVTTTSKAVTPLIWHILKGGEVDVARIISRELRHVALSGLTLKLTKLSFPGFIMRLVQALGVQIPGPFGERLVGPIDDKYILSHIKLMERKLAASASSIPDPEPEAPEPVSPH